jgi:uncharacterized iron-regulated protein
MIRIAGVESIMTRRASWHAAASPGMGGAICLLAGLLLGCGRAPGAGSTAPARAGGGVEAAALPYRILRARGGGEIPRETFFAELAASRAVCIGESHPSPHDHWAQLEILGVLTQAGRRGARVQALGMEMFQNPFQGVLDDFGAGRIDEAALLARSGWAERWGYDFALYRPMIGLARRRGLALVALNAPRELSKRVSHAGLEGLGARERARVPELVLDDAEHRAWFDDIMRRMGGHHGHHGQGGGDTDDRGRAERIYTVQVLWDETMAETAARWLRGAATRQMILLAGNGHCHDSAIVRRLRRRGVAEVVSVRPIVDDGQGNVAGILAEPHNDYVFVMEPPR